MLSFGTNRSPLAVFCNLLFLNGLLPFCNNDVMFGGWYVGTTMLLYLVAPLLFWLYEKPKSLNGKRVLCLSMSILSVTILILIAILFPQYEALILRNNSFGYFFVLTQFPCFTLGMLLFFDFHKFYLYKQPSVYWCIGLIVMLMSVLLFFNPFFQYSYILTVCLVGISAYCILKGMLYYERSNVYCKIFDPLVLLGRKSFYVYLVHAFFARDLVRVVRGGGMYDGCIEEDSVLFFVLIPFVILGSYYAGCALEFIVRNVCGIRFKCIIK